jgi:hypothetical protein
MGEYERKQIEDFFKAIELNLPCYTHSYFSFIAIKQGTEFQLAQGQLQLQAVPEAKPSGSFQSENVRAGLFRLSELKHSPREFVEALLSGKIRTPFGEISFLPEQGRSYSIYFAPYHFEGAQTQRRQVRLALSGDRRVRTDTHTLDWELKAAPTPFFNVQELCDEFSVGMMRGDSTSVEVTALPVSVISQESIVNGVKARFVMDLAGELPHEKASIGYRVFGRKRDVKRGVLNGASLSWAKQGEIQRGIGEIEVPAGAVIDCIASYAGVAQQHIWITDPKTAQNPLRSVHDAFDNNLSVLRELIDKSQKKGTDARELEMAVSWILWLLGFSATHIGGTGKTSDAPDLIAATPMGNLVVIECTTGILREDSKLSHLVQRTEKVRQGLAASGNQNIKVLPIIVTTKTRDEVKAELEQAYKLGVLVATKEDFEQMIGRTIFLPDPNRLYAEGEESLRRLQSSQTQSVLFT